jgi:hypothetical protein
MGPCTPHAGPPRPRQPPQVKLAGGLRGWLGGLPALRTPELPEALRPPAEARSARFDVTFLDPELRVTRGDRGELRVFIKDATAAL